MGDTVPRGGVLMGVPYDPFDHPYLSLAGETRCRICLLQDHKESALTDQNDDGIDWGTQGSPEEVATWTPDDVGAPTKAGPSYPEYPPLAEAPISINFKVTGEPMITIRGFDASQICALINDLEDRGAWANIAAAQASLKAQGMLGGGLGPMSAVAPQGPPQASYGGPPQAGPPFGANVSVPSAPGYVGPQQSFQSGPPQQQQWQGGGGFGGGGNNQRAEPKPQPPGWLRVNGRSGPGFDAWKQLREQHKNDLKGKVQWGGNSDYWIEPSLGNWLAQQGFAVTP